MNRPFPNEYPVWGETYVSKVEGDVIQTLEEQITAVPKLFLDNKHKADFAYAKDKWSLKEMLGHIIDTERILVYRLTCFARNDKQELPGFEEDDYVINARFSERDLESLTEEFAALRKANLYLFKSLNDEELERKGNMAVNRQATVKAMLFIIAGHVNHHIQILKERYL